MTLFCLILFYRLIAVTDELFGSMEEQSYCLLF